MPEKEIKEKKPTIVIIDDDPDDRRIFSRYVEAGGFVPKVAESPREGIDMLYREAPDCVLLDYRMPGMDGIEIVRKIKSDPALKNIPVIMLTGLEDEGHIIEGLESGADDYIGKSSSQKLVLMRIKTAMRAKESRDEIKEINEKLSKANDELRETDKAKTLALEQLDKAILELRDLSKKDSLTKLYNHGCFREILDLEILRAERYSKNICCLMIDIDYFKKINDAYGHMFGDKVLSELAAQLKKQVREIDVLCRYGGEEFAALLINCDYEYAFTAAERLRGSIESYAFKIDDTSLKLTISIGISSLFEDGTLDKERLLRFADSALYEAKARGRNITIKYRDLIGNQFYSEADKLKWVEHKIYTIADVAKKAYIESIRALVTAHEEKDIYTREHSINVLRYSLMIAKEMGLPESKIEAIGNAAILHDLGKITITDEILHKSGKLSEEEFDVVKQHPLIAVHILQKGEYLKEELQLILYHHERYDGSGYPRGLKGKEIPLGARILSVADSYDAMRSNRTYRSALDIKQIVKELVNNAGRQFDPEIVRIFFKAMLKYELLPPELVNIEEALSILETKID